MSPPRAGRMMLGVLAVLATWCGPLPAKGQDPLLGGRNKDEQGDGQQVLKVAGSVEPFAEARLFARITGYVAKAQADIGDRVKKGEVLAELAVPEREAELAKKKALVVQAEAEVQHAQGLLKEATTALDLIPAQIQEAEAGIKHARALAEYARITYLRFKRLADNKTVEQSVLDEAANKVEAARAALEAAESKLRVIKVARESAAAKRETATAGVRVARARLDVARADLKWVAALLQYARIVAPFDGVVTLRSINIGDLATPPQGRDVPLFIVARVDTVRVVVAVPETDAPHLRVGTEASVKVDALAGQVFKGKVTRTAGVLDPGKRTLRVEINLPNPDGKLLPGMYGTVALALGRD